FVPTHSLELIEAAALKEAVETGVMEDRLPVLQPADVLIQYMMTLAVADGFEAESVWQEVTQTYAYRDLDKDDFRWMLQFITTGGHSLSAYEAYRKAEVSESGRYQVTDKKIVLQHRLSIGSIVSDTGITVKFISGGRLGTVEESFISQLKEGDHFWFSGRLLELIRVRNLEALVRKASGNKGIVPRWMGTRMPLSSQMSAALRRRLDEYLNGELHTPEMQCLRPLLDLQHRCSAVPAAHECLIESIQSREGHHLYIYPFEGRVVHEMMATLTAWRISRLEPLTFSLAMNDYGFELLSDKPIPIEKALREGLFSSAELDADLHHSINETEMALRRFREIATIAGLLFKGYPGRSVQARHLQASSSLLFRVFQDYDPGNLLLRQAFTEVLDYQIDESRLRSALDRLDGKNILLKHPLRFTPFSFPIMTDRLRERLSSEKLADRIARMQVILEKAVS
ncbi:MAG: DNA ligase-associated DEXH box helicase, partial [Bacteroidetes bacterium]